MFHSKAKFFAVVAAVICLLALGVCLQRSGDGKGSTDGAGSKNDKPQLIIDPSLLQQMKPEAHPIEEINESIDPSAGGWTQISILGDKLAILPEATEASIKSLGSPLDSPIRAILERPNENPLTWNAPKQSKDAGLPSTPQADLLKITFFDQPLYLPRSGCLLRLLATDETKEGKLSVWLTWNDNRFVRYTHAPRVCSDLLREGLSQGKELNDRLRPILLQSGLPEVEANRLIQAAIDHLFALDDKSMLLRVLGAATNMPSNADSPVEVVEKLAAMRMAHQLSGAAIVLNSKVWAVRWRINNLPTARHENWEMHRISDEGQIEWDADFQNPASERAAALKALISIVR